MGYTIVQVESTPNPGARKLIVDPSPGRIVSCFNTTDLSSDPLARTIQQVDGITSLLVHQSFISVCFDPSATKWNTLKASLAKALRTLDDEGDSDA